MTQPVERARRLLVLAERDITSFRALAGHPEVDISATGFFAQQAVEKCLKAVAEYHGIVFRRTHDVDELVDLLLQHKIAVPFPSDQFSVLNPFAVILATKKRPISACRYQRWVNWLIWHTNGRAVWLPLEARTRLSHCYYADHTKRTLPHFDFALLHIINRRSIKTMKALLAICMMIVASFSWAGEDAAPHPAISVKGEVLEVKVVENFTYLRLQTQNGETWAAIVNAKAKKGDKVTIENVSVMENFESKSLKRTFKTILFGNLAGASNSAPKSPTLGAAFSASPAKKLDTINDAPVPKASGANAMTVAEVVANGAKLRGKPVVVRGRVVKYNADIMGKNWIHLRDGSAPGDAGDILVTTSSKANVGDILTVKGIVNTDQDFGAGYAYKVLIEEATLQK